MVNLYLIRHGRQNSTLCNVDVELAKEGQAQAKLLRDRLKNYHIDALYSSDMLRAVETATIINEALRLPHEIRENIREISFGKLEGMTQQYIEENFQDFKKEQFKLLDDVPYPGGENGASVCKRTMPVIQDILKSGKKDVLIITHGGVIRAILAELFGKNQAERFLFGVSLENTSITQVVYNPQIERFYLERFNDYSHLEGHLDLHRDNWKA